MNDDEEKLVETTGHEDAGCITSAMMLMALAILTLAMCSCCSRITPGGPESSVRRLAQ